MPASAKPRHTALPITIADQHTLPGQQTLVRRRHRPGHLVHEELGRMGCGPEHLNAAGGEVDDEHRVVRHEAAPRPDFRCKEIGPGDHAPMRL